MSDKKPDGGSEKFLAFLGALAGAYVAWSKYKFAIFAWYFKYRILIALGLAASVVALYILVKSKFIKSRSKKNLEAEIIGKDADDDSVFMGFTKENKRVYFRESQRRMHIEVIGTTNAGKTESVVAPLAIDDIKKGRGLLIIDGKSDRGLLDKIYAYARQYNRLEDVRILSLCDVPMSHTFNPLDGGSPLELTERLFNAFVFDNSYFAGLQREALLNTLLIFKASNIHPTCAKLVEALTGPRHLKKLMQNSKDPQLLGWVTEFLSLSREEREQRTSGLVTQLRMFAVDETAKIFNAENSQVNLEEALAKNQIIYCQLPVLKIPTLGKATGKMILQCLQSAVSSRHLSRGERNFFSVYLDDFTEYLPESFVSLLNKSRSANLSIVFAHQAIGDLTSLGDGVKNTILTNTNLKVFMRTNEPESAEYFSSVVGTAETTKLTERQNKGTFGPTKDGTGSVRAAEEFKFHPNLFKQGLGVGDAVVVLPHSRGSHAVQMKFARKPDLEVPNILAVAKAEPSRLPPLDDEHQTALANADKISHIPGVDNHRPAPPTKAAV